jgi:hypothetical protein
MTRAQAACALVAAVAVAVAASCSTAKQLTRPRVKITDLVVRAAVIDRPVRERGSNVDLPVFGHPSLLILTSWDFRVSNIPKPGVIYTIGHTFCDTGFTGVVPPDGHVHGEALCHGNAKDGEDASAQVSGTIAGPGIQNEMFGTNDTIKDNPTSTSNVQVTLEPPWRTVGAGGVNKPGLGHPTINREGPKNCTYYRFRSVTATANLTTGHIAFGGDEPPDLPGEELIRLSRQIYLPSEGLLVNGVFFTSSHYEGDWLWPFERRLDWTGAEVQVFAYVYGFASEPSATCDVATGPVEVVR